MKIKLSEAEAAFLLDQVDEALHKASLNKSMARAIELKAAREGKSGEMTKAYAMYFYWSEHKRMLGRLKGKLERGGQS